MPAHQRTLKRWNEAINLRFYTALTRRELACDPSPVATDSPRAALSIAAAGSFSATGALTQRWGCALLKMYSFSSLRTSWFLASENLRECPRSDSVLVLEDYRRVQEPPTSGQGVLACFSTDRGCVFCKTHF